MSKKNMADHVVYKYMLAPLKSEVSELSLSLSSLVFVQHTELWEG